MSGGRRCVEVPVIEIGKDAEDKTRRQAVDDLFLFKAGRWRAMRRWRDQRKADYFHLGRGIFRRINAASPSASAPLRPPPSLHLCGSQLEYAPQSENSTFEPSQSTFEQAPTPAVCRLSATEHKRTVFNVSKGPGPRISAFYLSSPCISGLWKLRRIRSMRADGRRPA